MKLSFEDIVKLYRFIDKEGKGEIGYDEFTLLTEEKWRGIDPFQAMQANIAKVQARQNAQEQKKNDCLAELDGLQTEIERLARLEEMAMNRSKLFRGSQQQLKNYKINRLDPSEGEDMSNLRASGIKTVKRNDIEDIMKHNYLRKSLEQRI